MSYPKLTTVDCAICGATVHLVIEQVIGTPKTTGGLMRVPFDYVPTVLDGCDHWHPPLEEDDDE